MGSTESPLCNICDPPRRHRRGEPHNFSGSSEPEPETVTLPPKPKSPLKAEAKSKIIAGLKETIAITKGEASPARVTIIRRDRDKQAAYMREYRKRQKAKT